jgi:hypothetical protein
MQNLQIDNPDATQIFKFEAGSRMRLYFKMTPSFFEKYKDYLLYIKNPKLGEELIYGDKPYIEQYCNENFNFKEKCVCPNIICPPDYKMVFIIVIIILVIIV